MKFVTLEALPRTPGKSQTRQVRNADQVPCVLYGAGTETISFQVQQLDLRPLVFTDQFRRIRVMLEGKSYDCILKRVDYHPTKDIPSHVDFQRLVDGTEIHLRVPVHYVGNAPGVLAGGTPQEFIHKIAIRCLPKHIPDNIEIDISGLSIGQSILIREIEVEGVSFDAPPDQTLIAITRPRELTVDEEEDEELEGDASDQEMTDEDGGTEDES
jgi:large subunit ribosomal protein L25